jgi:hypothetical protein
VEVVTGANGESCWSDDGDFEIDLHDFTVRIYGEAVRRSPGRDAYEAAGIDLAAMRPELAFIRLLAHDMPEQLLLSPQAVLARLDRTGMDLALRLTKWHEPEDPEGDLPSTHPCFTAIAATLVAGALIDISPCVHTANNHWSSWTSVQR